MITNRHLNSMIKPNIVYGEYTVSNGVNTDAGIGLISGKVNHHTAMVLDIIYDHMYRMFNATDNTDFIESSLTHMLATNEGKRHDYLTKLITDKKLDFYTKVIKLGQYFEQCRKNDVSVPYDERKKDLLLNGSPEIIENAFGPEFSIPYNYSLEYKCEKEGTLDEPLTLLNEFKFERQFFMYLLNNIFYGKYPQWNTFQLKINLHRIFNKNERTVYVLKQWFEEANDLVINMTYPATCISEPPYKGLPKKLFLKPYMMPLIKVKPIASECGKHMNINVSLINKFMVFFAHDAKMCIGSYMPSLLYTLNSNAYFIGKAILNNTYYSKTKKKYTNKLDYTLAEIFDFLNLPEKDTTNGNSSYRKKAIFKALRQLNDKNIIKIDKMTSDKIKLNYVWSIGEDQGEDPINDDI